MASTEIHHVAVVGVSETQPTPPPSTIVHLYTYLLCTLPGGGGSTVNSQAGCMDTFFPQQGSIDIHEAPLHELTRSKTSQGTGNIGKPIVQELASQGFQVTILSRGSSKQDDVPEGVTVKTVDYDDIESLKGALAGQDAVVSAIATAGVSGQQQRLADAALGT